MMWRAVSALTGLAAGLAARRATTALLSRMSSRGAGDSSPADPRTPWTTALGWSAAIGVGAGVARTVAQRVAARGWERATGEPPPAPSS